MSLKFHSRLKQVGLSVICAVIIVLSGAAVSGRIAEVHAGNGVPTVVVDYFHNGKLLGRNTTKLDGFDLGWKPTGCSGKWLSKPVIVLPEAGGTLNSPPIPVPCNGKTKPAATRNEAVHDGPIETVDVLGWLVTGSTWWVSWSVLKGPNGPPTSMVTGTTGIHVYLYGGNTFTKESWVKAGKIMPEQPRAKIPPGANQAFIHLAAGSTG